MYGLLLVFLNHKHSISLQTSLLKYIKVIVLMVILIGNERLPEDMNRFYNGFGGLCGRCGVRSVENEECGKWGVWKMGSVENGECGK